MKRYLDFLRSQLLERYVHLKPMAESLERKAASLCIENDNATIVIVCKNQQKTIAKVIDRIAAQTRRPDLVILTDDCSTDDSLATFIQRCKRHDLNWSITSLPPGSPYRLNTIRNRGFSKSLNGLVLLMDADMILSPVYVERHLKLHRESESVIMSSGPRFEYASDALAGPVGFMWGLGVEAQAIGTGDYVLSWQRCNGAFCVNRAVWEAYGGFDEAYNGRYGIDDLDLIFQFFLARIYVRSDFEAYVIHIPHLTTFSEGMRDSSENLEYFVKKFNLDPDVLADPIDFSLLRDRSKNWAAEFEKFAAEELSVYA